ncbi:MAG: cell wall-binding protein, partial [endosymbiont of Galathealinum brachiosum]
TYNDAGATASDNFDGDITANISIVSNVNTNAVGNYSVTYNVSDATGNAASTVTRVVNVTTDVTVPVITLLGSTPVNIELGGTYND